MMTNTLSNRCLAEVSAGPSGESVTLLLTNTFPPYGTTVLRCENVLLFRFQRTADDAAPYFLGEIGWRAVASLAGLGDSLLAENGETLPSGWPQAVHVHFEGAVCGDVVCQTCQLQEELLPSVVHQ